MNNDNKIVEGNEPVTLNVKKPKKKGKKVFLLLFFLLLIAAGVCTWYVMNNNDKDKKESKPNTEKKEYKKDSKKENKKEEKKDEDKQDDKKESDKIVYFYTDDNFTKMTTDYDKISDKKSIISKYMCDSSENCGQIADQYFSPSMTDANGNLTGTMINNKAFIQDGKQKVLFDIVAGEVVEKYGSKAYWLQDKQIGKYSPNSGRYIVIKDKDNKYYGIIDSNGNTIHSFNIEYKNDDFSSIYQDFYSIENNYLVNSKNGKYGITRITSEDIVVDYIYDDIRLLDDNNYKALENDKWYVYSIANKTKVLNDGYDYILGIYEGALVVVNNKKLYIKDLQGNDLINAPIDVYDDIIEHPSVVDNYGVSIEKDSYILTINISKNHKGYEKYKYNIATKTLEKE